MADAAFLQSATSALGPTLLGSNDSLKKEVETWLAKIKDGAKELSDLKVSSIANAGRNPALARCKRLATTLQKASSAIITLRLALTLVSLRFSFYSHQRSLTVRQSLDKTLENKTFLVGNDLTLADLSLFSLRYAEVSKLPIAEQHANLNVTRYFSHISHLAAQLPHSESSKYAAFDPTFDGQPSIERQANVKAPKDGKKTGAVVDAASASTQGAAPAANKKEKKAAKEPSAAAAAGGKKKGNEPAAPVVPLPSQVDLRVGKIVDIKRHPDADSLYLEQVDFGEPEGPRTILSGLVKYVPIEKMENRWVVGVCNLKPASMRGIKSYGMLLCASQKEDKDAGVEPVTPPEGSELGDRVYVEGFEGLEPEAVLNPKKKVGDCRVGQRTTLTDYCLACQIFETIQPNYTTTTDFTCAWTGAGHSESDSESKTRIIRTAKGPCTAPGFANAMLS